VLLVATCGSVQHCQQVSSWSRCHSPAESSARRWTAIKLQSQIRDEPSN